MKSKGLPPKLVVAEMISCGELDENSKSNEDIIDQCDSLLLKASQPMGGEAIVGRVLFKATDGRYYTVTVRAAIRRASGALVEDVLAEAEAERRQNAAEGEANGVPAK